MLNKESSGDCTVSTCRAKNRAIKDALDVLNGSWKLQILVSLSEGTKRFKEISREVEGISDKMLSKELKDLEMNQLVTRTVRDTFPPTVEYSVTDHAATLKEVMIALSEWGILHRNKIIGS
ncbi:winged helix-turn-helix transcriptional regulator [Flavobacterium silvaticum]|uniref:Helix-turn-helix transcriptional regulator n=1 Tax=Flavobacterium silvaticum TaxID=1852020 RepID=A0A972FIH6_9FLAO|nr:helix-turn-helix domain-containing protein [Flavobacterium silvaticum]NMH26581.1 helix-turn-helix transcriptional regulator [Flavobacterium silvaticum]